MHLGFDYRFPWAERSGRPDHAGAVHHRDGDDRRRARQTLTGSSTAWNTNNAFTVKNMRANGKVRIAGSLTPYTMQSVSSDTAAVTLSSKFTEADASAQTYIYYEDEYDLASDFLRPVDMQQLLGRGADRPDQEDEFRRRYPTNSRPGTPSVACIIDSAPSGNTTPVRRVRFQPPPSTAMTIPYTYITSNLA
jgi:hypothetical protein